MRWRPLLKGMGTILDLWPASRKWKWLEKRISRRKRKAKAEAEIVRHKEGASRRRRAELACEEEREYQEHWLQQWEDDIARTAEKKERKARDQAERLWAHLRPMLDEYLRNAEKAEDD